MPRVLLGISLCVLAASLALALPSPKAASLSPQCSDAAHRQFDFWLGDWDTYRVGSTASVARNQVSSILGGCVLHEVYTRNDGYTGESFTIYDAARKRWHQSWVTNQGELLVAEGTKEGNTIVLTGSTFDKDGETVHRVTWLLVDDGVRETAEQSHDGGKHWQPEFDIVFRPSKRGQSDPVQLSGP